MGVKPLPTFTIMLYISIFYAFTLSAKMKRNNFFASKARSALESQVSYGSAGYFIRDT